MADAITLQIDAISCNLRHRTLSGTVTVSAVPAQRTVLVYRNNDTCATATTTSDASSGHWSVTVNSSPNDNFRVVIVARSGEFSKVFEAVKTT